MRAVTVLVAGAMACSHVDFAPPPANLTQAQRIAMFHQLRGVSEKRETSCSRGVYGGLSCSQNRSIMLADGTEVTHPEDLLPLLPPEHEAARAAQRSTHARSRAGWWGMGALVSVLAGAWLVLDAQGWDTGTTNETQQGLGIGVAVLGGLIGAGGAYFYRAEANEEETNTYNWYTQGLAQRLHLCVSALAVVPCEGTAAPSFPPIPAPAPATAPAATPATAPAPAPATAPAATP